MRDVVVSVVGKDRPGIVAGVTQVLFEVGSNLRDTSMCILSGHFAMLLVVDVPPGVTLAALEARLEEKARELSLTVTVSEAEVLAPPRAGPSGEPEEDAYMITVAGADRPGIVYRVATLLAGLGLNITGLETRLLDQGGKSVYVMMLEATPKENLAFPALESSLQALSRELSVEVKVKALDPVSL